MSLVFGCSIVDVHCKSNVHCDVDITDIVMHSVPALSPIGFHEIDHVLRSASCCSVMSIAWYELSLHIGYGVRIQPGVVLLQFRSIR